MDLSPHDERIISCFEYKLNTGRWVTEELNTILNTSFRQLFRRSVIFLWIFSLILQPIDEVVKIRPNV